eukprot:scaffold46174_cov25-Prasinocladus_malaysianus.AAC.2
MAYPRSFCHSCCRSQFYDENKTFHFMVWLPAGGTSAQRKSGMRKSASQLVVFNQRLIEQIRLYNLWCLRYTFCTKPLPWYRRGCMQVRVCVCGGNKGP